MKREILDTNVIVRFLVNDHRDHHRQALRWFTEAQQGKREIIVSSLVIAETSFVLESFYKIKRAAVADALEVFIAQRWLDISDRDVLISAWRYYRNGLHFVDSYLKAWCEVYDCSLLTFDKKLAKTEHGGFA